MSLSLLIDRDKYLRNEIRDAFQLSELRLKFEKTRPLLAPPKTNNSQLVGVAFDYLLRFYLQKLNDLPYDRENQWVAEKEEIYCLNLVRALELKNLNAWNKNPQKSINVHEVNR